MTRISRPEHAVVAVVWLPVGIAVNALWYLGFDLHGAWRDPLFWIFAAVLFVLCSRMRSAANRKWQAQS